MKSIQPELDYFNSNHIPEPTAYDAFAHKKEREGFDYDRQLLREIMGFVRRSLKGYGFELTRRIEVRSMRTGRIFK